MSLQRCDFCVEKTCEIFGCYVVKRIGAKKATEDMEAFKSQKGKKLLTGELNDLGMKILKVFFRAKIK